MMEDLWEKAKEAEENFKLPEHHVLIDYENLFREKCEWIYTKEDNDVYVSCSGCGSGIIQEPGNSILLATMKMYFRYCPFCGALMKTYDDEKGKKA